MCFYCGSKYTKKNGQKREKQLYKCHDCKRQFIGGTRIDSKELWDIYVEGKQTYSQLADRYNCSLRTIQRRLDTIKADKNPLLLKKSVVLMDTTYFGRKFGVMLFKDALTGRNLLTKFVKYETNQLNYDGLQELISRGVEVTAIVCDGRRGLFTKFQEYPIQMCQFHQIAIIKRYLTRNPKLEASKELIELSKLLTTIENNSFVQKLQNWYEKWKTFLNERSINPNTQKKYYTHKKLRSAYFSIKRNLPYLFTFQDNSDLKIPNTTNAIDGQFSNLKSKLRVHNGLSIIRKKKFINEFLKA